MPIPEALEGGPDESRAPGAATGDPASPCTADAPPTDPPLASPLPNGTTPGNNDLAAELRVAIMRTSRRLRIDASGHSISAGQYSVLVALSGGPQTLGRLAARENVQAPSMTRIVKALQDKGYAERQAHPDDGRQVLIGITSAGAAALDEARGQRTAWLSRRVAELGDKDRDVLARAASLLQGMSAQ